MKSQKLIIIIFKGYGETDAADGRHRGRSLWVSFPFIEHQQSTPTFIGPIGFHWDLVFVIFFYIFDHLFDGRWLLFMPRGNPLISSLHFCEILPSFSQNGGWERKVDADPTTR